jgi:integrase
MPKAASLEPVKIPGRKAPWLLDVPPTLSSTGKRQRLYFGTKEDAEFELSVIRERRMFGEARLSPTQAYEAIQAIRLLEPLGVSLVAAVSGFIDMHNRRSASATFRTLFDQYLDSRSDYSPAYRKELRISRDKFAPLHDRMVSDLQPRDFEPLLDALPASARNACMRYLRAVFTFGIRRGFLSENPAKGLDFVRVKKKETEVFSPEQIQGMLDYSLESDLGLVPYFVFCAFAGVRADGEGEISKLEWSDISLTEKSVTLRPEITKKNRRRSVDLSENALAWIMEYRNRGGKTDGPVVAYKDEALRNHRRKVQHAAGVDKWIQAGLRHTFCSYHLAMHENVDRLVIQSGHENVETMWKSYYRVVTKASAGKFVSAASTAMT